MQRVDRGSTLARMQLPPLVEAWRARGSMVTLPGALRVFTVEAGAKQAERTILVLHGFPTSSSDWAPVLPQLAAEHRVLLFDFPGYGLSDKPSDYGYSLFEQADVVVQLARRWGVERAHVVAHDMGTSVATELLARRERGLLPFGIDSLVLTNGSVYADMAQLTPAQKILLSPAGDLFSRVASERVFRLQMGRILSRPVADEELAAMWAQLRYLDGSRRMPAIIEYYRERTRFAARWHGALRRLDVRTLVLWAAEDPVAVLAIGERLAREIPGAEKRILEGVGHYPMLEDPDRVARAILEHVAG